MVSTAGTTNIKQLTEANAAKNLNITIVPAKDHAEAFLMVETDRAAAFVMDDILLASLVAGSKSPGDYVISKDAFSKPEPYGIMLRRDDPAFKKVVDAATAAVYTSGEGAEALRQMVHCEDSAEGSEPQHADRAGAEGGVRQAVGFAGSGFLQGDVRIECDLSAASAVRSLPPCGGGLGRGVYYEHPLARYPHPQPLPARGEGSRAIPRIAP